MLKRLFASRMRPYIPGVDEPEHIEFDLAANKLRLILPPHSDFQGGEEIQAPITHVNIYDTSLYSAPEKPFSNFVFIERTWELYGSIWHVKPLGYVEFSAAVGKVNCLPHEMSCFNPNHFEQVVNRFIYSIGPEAPNISEHMQAPFNWRVNDQHKMTGVSFEQRKDLSKMGGPEAFSSAHCLSFNFYPLDDRYCLKFMFKFFGYDPIESAIDQMNDLRDKVLQNTKIYLSQSALSRLEVAQQQWPDAKISKHRQPENWQYPEWRAGRLSKDEPEIVIVKPGSPPPGFKL